MWEFVSCVFVTLSICPTCVTCLLVSCWPFGAFVAHGNHVPCWRILFGVYIGVISTTAVLSRRLQHSQRPSLFAIAGFLQVMEVAIIVIVIKVKTCVGSKQFRCLRRSGASSCLHGQSFLLFLICAQKHCAETTCFFAVQVDRLGTAPGGTRPQPMSARGLRPATEGRSESQVDRVSRVGWLKESIHALWHSECLYLY